MKKYKYNVTFKNGRTEVVEIEAENVLDGHYQIYRMYGRTYDKSCYVK